MDGFQISLAGIPIGIKPYCPEIQSFFADYLTCEDPCFTIAPSKNDLEYEKHMFEKRNGEGNSPVVPLKTIDLESSAILRLIAERIAEYDAILFHGSAVAVKGKTFLFAARSGTGKSTHTRLWLQQLPQAYVLNGDKPFLKIDDSGEVLVCGSPWRGKERWGCNEMLPLEAICLLERAEDNRICPITPKESTRALIHQVQIPEGAAALRSVQILNRISTRVRLFRLSCNMEPEAAQISICAMMTDG